MSSLPLLSLLIFIPLAASVFILVLARGEEEQTAQNARTAALCASLINFFLSLALWFGFDRKDSGYQFVEKVDWIEELSISYYLGVDGISVLFVLLATLLTPVCILSSWTAVRKRVKEYMVAFLLLETLMIGTFCALDLFLFYLFFEAVLIPMFLIIGIWGGARRVYSAFKFFLYTLGGSVFMLVGMICLFVVGGTSDIPVLSTLTYGESLQIWLWIAFFASFAVKMPMWPMHTWLPDAHVEAPTGGSVILAGVLLKMGGYGFLRFSLPMLPNASQFFAPLIFTLSVIAVIYASLVALVQKDMKKLIAYSSVAHMAFVTIGIFTFTQQGLEGAIFQMLSHGVISSALFLLVGVIYDRLHTREIARFGGLANNMPHYAVIFLVFTMASVGLPGTSGFVGEFLILAGIFSVSIPVAFFATTGIVLGACYMLWLYRRVVFGPLLLEDVKAMKDLTMREMFTFVPLVILIFWLGIYPVPFLDIISGSVENLISHYESAVGISAAGMN